nr:type II secretion system protein [uncultured Roseateles sp.]
MKGATSQRGFTYLGALFFVALLGSALALAGELWSTQAQRDREEELLFAGRQIRNAIASYYEGVPVGQQRRFPLKLQELLEDKRWPTVRRHLRRLYVDPMTGAADWELIVAPSGGVIGVRSRATTRPLKRAGFDEDEEAFDQAASVGDWRFSAAMSGAGSKAPGAAAPSTGGSGN